MFEHHSAGGFRWRSKTERIGPMIRFIWGFWSVAYFPRKIGINDLFRVIRKDERQRIDVVPAFDARGVPGRCGNCNRSISKIPNSPHAITKGGDQYIYPDDAGRYPDKEYCIFRCEDCHEVVENHWRPASESNAHHQGQCEAPSEAPPA